MSPIHPRIYAHARSWKPFWFPTEAAHLPNSPYFANWRVERGDDRDDAAHRVGRAAAAIPQARKKCRSWRCLVGRRSLQQERRRPASKRNPRARAVLYQSQSNRFDGGNERRLFCCQFALTHSPFAPVHCARPLWRRIIVLYRQWRHRMRHPVIAPTKHRHRSRSGFWARLKIAPLVTLTHLQLLCCHCHVCNASLCMTTGRIFTTKEQKIIKQAPNHNIIHNLPTYVHAFDDCNLF